MPALLGHAVTDGPDGTAVVVVPQDTDEARRLRRAHPRGFWCGTTGGGCGHQLELVAGDVRAKYFRHRAGEAHYCALADEPEAIERSLLHLLLQTILSDWLATQGLDSTIEAPLPEAGRADLRVTLGRLDHTIEVQISSIPVPQWTHRDQRYRGRVQTVTWLFGAQVSQALVAEALTDGGVAFKIAHDEHLPLAEVIRPDHILVGTTSHTREDWHPLGECKMTLRGLWTPTSDLALAEHADWLRKQATPPPPKPQRHSGGYGGATFKPKLEGKKPTPARSGVTPSDPPPTDSHRTRTPSSSPPGPQPEIRAQGRNPLSSFDWFLGFEQWETPAGLLDGLPAELHHAARVLAYMTTRIESTGPRTALVFPDVDDGDQLQRALVEAELIELYEGPGGCSRWRRRTAGWSAPTSEPCTDERVREL